MSISLILRQGLSRVLSDIAWTSASLSRTLAAPESSRGHPGNPGTNPAKTEAEAVDSAAEASTAAVAGDRSTETLSTAPARARRAPPKPYGYTPEYASPGTPTKALTRDQRRWSLQQMSDDDLELIVLGSSSGVVRAMPLSFLPSVSPDGLDPSQQEQLAERAGIIEKILVGEYGPVVPPLRQRTARLTKAAGGPPGGGEHGAHLPARHPFGSSSFRPS